MYQTRERTMPEKGNPGGETGRPSKIFGILRAATSEIIDVAEGGIRDAAATISHKIDELTHMTADRMAEYHGQRAKKQGFSADQVETIKRYTRMNYPLQGSQPSQGQRPGAGL